MCQTVGPFHVTVPSDRYSFFHNCDQVALTDWVRRVIKINGLLGLLRLQSVYQVLLKTGQGIFQTDDITNS